MPIGLGIFQPTRNRVTSKLNQNRNFGLISVGLARSVLNPNTDQTGYPLHFPVEEIKVALLLLPSPTAINTIIQHLLLLPTPQAALIGSPMPVNQRECLPLAPADYAGKLRYRGVRQRSWTNGWPRSARPRSALASSSATSHPPPTRPEPTIPPPISSTATVPTSTSSSSTSSSLNSSSTAHPPTHPPTAPRFLPWLAPPISLPWPGWFGCGGGWGMIKR